MNDVCQETNMKGGSTCATYLSLPVYIVRLQMPYSIDSYTGRGVGMLMGQEDEKPRVFMSKADCLCQKQAVIPQNSLQFPWLYTMSSQIPASS